MSLDALSGLIWRPTFTYEDCGSENSIELLLPQRNWGYWSHGQGGHDEAASGVQEGFVYRHDRGRVCPLRFTETEWIEKVEPMLKVLWDQPQAFTLQLDANDGDTADSVRLVRPMSGEQARPTPDPDYPGVLELEIVVRTADGSHQSYPYFTSGG